MNPPSAGSVVLSSLRLYGPSTRETLNLRTNLTDVQVRGALMGLVQEDKVSYTEDGKFYLTAKDGVDFAHSELNVAFQHLAPDELDALQQHSSFFPDVRALHVAGWLLLDLTVNTTTGFVRMILEKRDNDDGRMLTLLRSSHDSRTVVVRDITRREPGMFQSHWAVVDSLGHTRYETIRSALLGLALYLSDNSDGKLSPQAAKLALLPVQPPSNPE